MQITLTLYEAELLIEALAKAEGRLASEARYYGRETAFDKSRDMRDLRTRLVKTAA